MRSCVEMVPAWSRWHGTGSTRNRSLPGSPGTTGTWGNPGRTGTVGVIGFTGVGFVGTVGVIGFTGFGFVGTVGVIGFTGVGFVGTVGVIGTMGVPGSTGGAGTAQPFAGRCARAGVVQARVVVEGRDDVTPGVPRLIRRGVEHRAGVPVMSVQRRGCDGDQLVGVVCGTRPVAQRHLLVATRRFHLGDWLFDGRRRSRRGNQREHRKRHRRHRRHRDRDRLDGRPGVHCRRRNRVGHREGRGNAYNHRPPLRRAGPMMDSRFARLLSYCSDPCPANYVAPTITVPPAWCRGA